MAKLLITFSVLFALLTSNAFAKKNESTSLNQVHTLTLDSVYFDRSTGMRTIGAYGANQKDSTSSIAANKSFILSSCTHTSP